MRRFALLFPLSIIAALSAVVACAPSSDDESVDDTGALTGGTKSVESPVVFLFEKDAKAKASPACVGALLASNIAVTAKACAKEGMLVGRAGDKNGKGTQVAVRALHVPEEEDAEIVLIELDGDLDGSPAVITHAPLKDGYAINSFSAVDEKKLLAPSAGQAASIRGKLASETDTYSTLMPAKGTKLCAGDVGAPVCSSTGFKIFSYNVTGTCGLSGLVIGQDVIDPNLDGSTPSLKNNVDENDCSAGPWKVVQLGRYAEFLKKYAPQAFEPTVIDKPVLRDMPTPAPGLWGYKSGGTVSQCKIATTTLGSVAVNTKAKVSAQVSFAKMERLATPFARVGIASKSTPSEMRWFPARSSSPTSGTAYSTIFEGVVQAAVPGEYIVAVRVSPDGGETWTKCDVDGSANGFDDSKILSLTVTEKPASKPSSDNSTPPSGTSSSTSSSGSTTPPSSDNSTPPSGTSTSSSGSAAPPASNASTDSSYADSPTTPSEDPVIAPKKTGANSSGCSVGPASGTTNSFAAVGLMLGLAAIVRRRGKCA